MHLQLVPHALYELPLKYALLRDVRKGDIASLRSRECLTILRCGPGLAVLKF